MRFKRPRLQLDPLPATYAPSNRWSNKDMDPVPAEQRSWRWYHIVAYWISDAFNVPTWSLASAMIAVGLGFRASIAAIVVGQIFISVPMTLHGYIGAKLHIPFPVLARSSFGFYFSYFAVVSRVVLACFWFGIQTTTGGNCVREMIKAIWPSFASFPNRLSADAGTTSQDLLCYFLYWLIQFPFVLVHPTKVKTLFILKSILTPVCGISLMAWAFHKTGGGPIFSDPARLHGSAAAWQWLGGLNAVLGQWSTLAVNIGDFTRYARSPREQYVQPFIIPIAFTFISFMGISVTSASKIIYGEYYWDPLQLIARWGNSPGERAARFFCAFAFTLATLGTNIAANSISAGNDFNALLPRYLNIRRGSILCAFIGGWVLVPWYILASAPRFLAFAGGYAVFLAPIAGVMTSDYFLVKKGRISVPAMYRPRGIYRYQGGINWRSLVAMLVGCIPCFPGFLHNINPAIGGEGTMYMFSISWIYGYFVTAATYWLVSTLAPDAASTLPAAEYGDLVTQLRDQESIEGEGIGSDGSDGGREKSVAVVAKGPETF
ncbi:hypothetical protein TWF696_007752 [Orbilia brochopaga]|uniref:Allantoin permease n=1 Tax=Orbilia brochopaga TaxID=3140254 RepID=A0AAV9ULZ6_9PEZI